MSKMKISYFLGECPKTPPVNSRFIFFVCVNYCKWIFTVSSLNHFIKIDIFSYWIYLSSHIIFLNLHFLHFLIFLIWKLFSLLFILNNYLLFNDWLLCLIPSELRLNWRFFLKSYFLLFWLNFDKNQVHIQYPFWQLILLNDFYLLFSKSQKFLILVEIVYIFYILVQLFVCKFFS